jgi:hypothetical protein
MRCATELVHCVAVVLYAERTEHRGLASQARASESNRRFQRHSFSRSM